MRNVVALVTLFFPDEESVENVKLIAEQVGLAILIDNTPQKDNSEMFKEICKTKYFANLENLGLSAAFNKYLQFEEVKKSDFVIFFDQDSTVKEKIIEKLICDYEFLEKTHKVGALGPTYFDEISKQIKGLFDDSEPVGNECFTVSAVITSSMLTRYENLKKIGFWNENVFLDYADLELCWRFLSAGFENFISKNVQLSHRLGNGIIKFYLPIKNKYVDIVYHSPVRLYYQVRESVKLMKKKYVPKIGRKTLFFESIERILAQVMNLHDKKIRLKYWFKGVFDGFRGVNGVLKER